MKINHRRKDKWVKNNTPQSDWTFDSKKSKTQRREKHQNKNKRPHQLHQFGELFEDDWN